MARKEINTVAIRIRKLTKNRLERMKAQAVVMGWSLKSLDEAVDILVQIWDKAIAKGMLENFVRPPMMRR